MAEDLSPTAEDDEEEKKEIPTVLRRLASRDFEQALKWAAVREKFLHFFELYMARIRKARREFSNDVGYESYNQDFVYMSSERYKNDMKKKDEIVLDTFDAIEKKIEKYVKRFKAFLEKEVKDFLEKEEDADDDEDEEDEEEEEEDEDPELRTTAMRLIMKFEEWELKKRQSLKGLDYGRYYTDDESTMPECPF